MAASNNGIRGVRADNVIVSARNGGCAGVGLNTIKFAAGNSGDDRGIGVEFSAADDGGLRVRQKQISGAASDGAVAKCGGHDDISISSAYGAGPITCYKIAAPSADEAVIGGIRV